MRLARLAPSTVVTSALMVLTAAGTGWAAPEPARALTLRDGARLVQAWRSGPFTKDGLGRNLAPVRLQYPGRPKPVTAWVDGTALVQLDTSVVRRPSDARDRLAQLEALVVRPLMPSAGLWLATSARADADEDGLALAERLSGPRAASMGIRQAFPNLYLRRKALADPFVPNDPRLPGQWYFDRLNMTEAWGIAQGDATTTIVVVDTGCDLNHVDLVDKLDPGRDVADEDDDPSADPAESGASHGTACAGIVGAETDNAEGIAGGCPNCRIRCVRLLTDEAQPLSAEVAAFQFALDVDAAVVSNSWGYVDSLPAPATVAAAIENLFDNGRGGRGALVVFAAGNDDRELGDDELTGVRGVLNVGAINNFDEQTPFTNFGASLDIVAYTGTLTTDLSGSAGSDPSDYMTNFGGTSSACPVVAGIAGLLASVPSEHTAEELYAILQQTARVAPYAVPDESGHDPVFGFGIVDPVAALEAIVEGPVGGSGSGGSGASGGAGPTLPVAGDSGDEGGCAVAPARHVGVHGAAWGGLALVVLGMRRRRG